eukprot:2965964-Prymnesium_polylepis.1
MRLRPHLLVSIVTALPWAEHTSGSHFETRREPSPGLPLPLHNASTLSTSRSGAKLRHVDLGSTHANETSRPLHEDCVDASAAEISEAAAEEGFQVKSCDDAAKGGFCASTSAMCPVSCGTCNISHRDHKAQSKESNGKSQPRWSRALQSTGGCSETCSYASDGYCDDGGPGAAYSSCAVGTDCTDCGRRSGGPPSAAPPTSAGGCSETCTYASDGMCDDGGPGAAYASCATGTDCTDCGSRTGGPSFAPPMISSTPSTGGGGGGGCSETCTYASDGYCDDGGPGAAYSSCA